MVFLKDIVCILFNLLKRIFALAFLIPFINTTTFVLINNYMRQHRLLSSTFIIEFCKM